MAAQIHHNIPCLTDLCLETVLNYPETLVKMRPDIQMAIGSRMINFIISKKSDNFSLLKLFPLAAKQITSLNLSNHPYVTDIFLAQLPDLFPGLIHLDLENCSIVADPILFKKFKHLSKLILKGNSITQIAAVRLAKSFEGRVEVCLLGISFIAYQNQ